MYGEILPKTNDISCFIHKGTYLCYKEISLKVGFNILLCKNSMKIRSWFNSSSKLIINKCLDWITVYDCQWLFVIGNPLTVLSIIFCDFWGYINNGGGVWTQHLHHVCSGAEPGNRKQIQASMAIHQVNYNPTLRACITLQPICMLLLSIRQFLHKVCLLYSF